MNKLNLIKKIILLPFIILIMPVILFILFFLTDWADKKEIKYSWNFLKDFFKF